VSGKKARKSLASQILWRKIMLDQFIESKSNKTANRQSRQLLFSTFSLLTVLSFSAVIWSIFSRDLVLASDSLEFSALAAPIAEIEPQKDEPKEPEMDKPKTNSRATTNQFTIRKVDMSRVDESLDVPDKVSTTPNTSKERPKNRKAVMGNIDLDSEDPVGVSNSENRGYGKGSTSKSTKGIISKKIEIEDDEPLPVVEKTKVVEEVKKLKSNVSLGVLTGKAISLPKPPYSAAAKAIGASGVVSVQITIDANGNVISANATSGHPILRADCEKAALNAKFSPTLLSKIAVKATGILTYNFIR
jgi:outer membrane biosynthesis protein TonB